MMKKKWLSALALSFTLAFAFSGTACEFFGVNIGGKEDDSANSSSSTPDGENITDEEIFTEVKEATIASCAYDGAYTMKMSGVQKLGDREMTAGGTYTADPTTKKMAMKGMEGQDGGVSKVYEKDGKYYGYNYYEDLEDSSNDKEECYEISEELALDGTKEELPSETIGDRVAFTLADSFEYLQSAYNVVATASLAELKEEIPTAVGECSVSVEYEGGVSSLVIALRLAIEGVQDFTFTSRVDAKDGKIVRASTSQKGTMIDTYGWYGEEGKEISANVEMAYEYAYTFDSEFFDSIIPCALTQPTEENNINIDFNVAGKFEMWGNVSMQEDKTGKELFEAAYNDAFGNWREDSYSFDKWYVDEACTKEFNPDNYTVEELRAIEDLYTPSITISDGYSLVVDSSREENKLSLAYQIVEGTGMFFFGVSSNKYRHPEMLEAGGDISFNIDDCDEFLVNGEKTTQNEWICEGGKIYYVERVEYYQDEDYNLFEDLLVG